MIPELTWILVLAAAVPAAAAAAAQGATAPLELVRTIRLPDVRGRIDHLAVDPGGARLFVAALGNDSVEVVDLHRGTRVARITGLHQPQGIGYVQSANRLFVANAGGGVDVFDASALRRASRVPGLDDADNVRDDAARGTVYVGYGHALATLDATDGRLLGTVELAGHPESFQLESTGPRIFVNVPDAAQIAVVERSSRKVLDTWSIGAGRANFPMALDEVDRRLFVATRRPAALLVFDTRAGALTAQLPLHGDADDLFYDAKRKRLYAICGEGFVDVFQQEDPDHYARAAEVRTVRGARTGLFVAARDSLFVAVPAHAGAPAEIRVFAAR